MATVELEYNPYLLETNIKFNGKEPHINSLVEKYQDDRLEDWVRLIPSIFKDEMNGLDFEVEFSGTDLDFSEVSKSFKDRGISEKQVTCTHKKNLEERNQKGIEIASLLKWLEDHPNRTFDFQAFKNENAFLYDNKALVIVLHGEGLETVEKTNQDVRFEFVKTTDELQNINIKDVPIVLNISTAHLNDLTDELRYFKTRPDVERDQLFFMIPETIRKRGIERFIQDLGIANPLIVENLQDDQIQKYCMLYPISAYLHLAVQAFQKSTALLKEQEKRTREHNEKVNAEIYQQIEAFEKHMAALKAAGEEFSNRGKLEVPQEWANAEEKMISSIAAWKSKKIKTTDQEEANNDSVDLNRAANGAYQSFLQEFAQLEKQLLSACENVCSRTYVVKGQNKADFSPQVQPVNFLDTAQLDEISHALLKINEQDYVSAKENILSSLFLQQDTQDSHRILETTYLYQEWRKYAEETVRKLAEQRMQKDFAEIQRYVKDLTEAYQKKIRELIEQDTKEKQTVSMKLSDDERKTQSDVDWLIKFTDQLAKIERE